MATITGIEKGLIDRIKKLSLIDELLQTTFISGDEQFVKLRETKKRSGIETSKDIQVIPNLRKTQIIYKDNNKYSLIITDETGGDTILLDKKICEYVSERLNRQFLEHLSQNHTGTSKWSYLDRTWISKVLSKRNPKSLMKKIIETGVHWDWIIMHQDIFEKIKNSTFFFDIPGNDCCGVINRGLIKMDNFSIRVYTSLEMDRKKLYFANQNSVHLLLKKRFDIKKIQGDPNSFSIGVDYSFVSCGEVSSIEL